MANKAWWVEKMREDLIKVLGEYAGWMSQEDWQRYLHKIQEVTNIKQI